MRQCQPKSKIQKIQAKDKPYYRSQPARARGKSQCENKRNGENPRASIRPGKRTAAKQLKYRLLPRRARASRLGQATTIRGQSRRQLNNHSPKSSKTLAMSRTMRKAQKRDQHESSNESVAPTKRYGIGDAIEEKNTKEV